jgi:hypothetical protein
MIKRNLKKKQHYLLCTLIAFFVLCIGILKIIGVFLKN